MATLLTDAVDRRSKLSFAEFNEEYLKKRRPVVITDAVEAWPALQTWTPEFFKNKYFGRMVKCRGQADPISMQDYIDALSRSSAEKPLPYLRNLNIQPDFPELVKDIRPRIIYSSPDWLSSALMPKNWPRPKNLNQLFISGVGARIRLHYDDWMTHNIVTNVYGDKRFIFFDQEQSEFLYRSGTRGGDYILSDLDPWAPDLERFPKYNDAVGHDVTIRRGETLFVPCGWWHSTYTTATCISVSSSFANWSNWPLLIQEIGRLREGANGLKTAAVVQYLQLVGRIGTVFQRPPS